jgi:hypothetical protein
MTATRIDAQQAHADLESGALLVCAYDDPAKFAQYHLNGAMPLEDLQLQEASLQKDQALIFYCG